MSVEKVQAWCLAAVVILARWAVGVSISFTNLPDEFFAMGSEGRSVRKIRDAFLIGELFPFACPGRQ